MKRKLIVFLILLLVITVFATTANADILNDIKSKSGGVTKEVDTAGTNIVNTVRQIALILGVIFFVLIAISIWAGGGDSRALYEAKGKLLGFVISMFIMLKAEMVVGWLANVFGYKF